MRRPDLIPLLDGALSADPRVARQQIIEEMAERLMEGDAFRDKADSILSLMATDRWSSFLIMTCLDDARQLAAVTREMGE